ncbi:MAG: 1-acyl-sn-glycerol-3-phosphate acyltransferase [Bacteroidia bacterium]|nr:1-acyl-sn-glycerol-3-phosphate acyltransferase [Bacteroidia bacterium]
MLWHILKYLLSFTIPAFYRKIQIKNVHFLKNNRPMIIASNHPNAFMDPIAFSYMVYPPRVRYMARGDAFKPGLVSKLLESIGIIPIFRMQDAGAEGVRKNNESYKLVYKLLKRNKKVMIFAEGICIQEKRLRPIKKGVPRLIFTAQQEITDKEIMIVPVCLNYSQPDKLGSTLFINVGEPFSVKNRMSEYLENPNQAMLSMMNELYQKMLPLIVHIENPNNDEIFEKTCKVLEESLIEKKQLHSNNLKHAFIVQKEIADCINYTSKYHSDKFNLFTEKINHLFNVIDKYDIDIPTLKNYQVNNFVLFIKVLVFSIVYIVYSSVYSFVKAFLFIPYQIAHYLAKKSAKSVEFYASFFLAYSTFIGLFYLMILFFILKNYFNPFLILAFFAFNLSFIPLLHYHPIFRRKYITLLKILKNKTFALNLSKNIQQTLSDYEHLLHLSKGN